MPGSYAHLTLADLLAADADALDAMDSLTAEMKYALLKFRNYCELGAVSPDYPYLTLLHPNAAGWANAMHYYGTTDFVRCAVPQILEIADRDARCKCIAWLFGVTTHIVADVTIHPVINLKVGPYEENKTPHRVCEMHQDVYIFNQYEASDVSAEYIKSGGIAACVDDSNSLDSAIVELWRHCLERVPLGIQVKPGIPGPTAAADPREWHRSFVALIETVAGAGGRLPPISRHFAEDCGVAYPELAAVDPEFIRNLPTPAGRTEDYDSIFARAAEAARNAWQQLGEALQRRDPERFRLPNADLDTGLANGQLLFWSA